MNYTLENPKQCQPNKVKLESEVFTLKSNLSESYISLKKIGCK